jgi:hypothetical protein
MLAASNLSAALPLLIALACPLMMILMMRGGHSHDGHGHGEAASQEHPTDTAKPRDQMTVEELERERAELDEQIASREPTTRVGA